MGMAARAPRDLATTSRSPPSGPSRHATCERGVKAGRFHVDDGRVALIAAGGALLGVMRAMLAGTCRPDAADHPTRRGVCGCSGSPPDDAAEVATRPLPEVSRP